MFIGKDILDGADVEEQEKEDDPPKPSSVPEVFKYLLGIYSFIQKISFCVNYGIWNRIY